MEAISALAIEVEELDPAGVLARIADAERRDREVQVEKLRLAYRWCVQHPATSATGAATWGDAGLPGLGDCDASLGGDGTPAVAPFVAEELGAAMGVSTQSAMSLMADALDLRHRLPRLWALVEDLVVAPWKSRRVATDTRSLPFESGRWVDEQLAARVDGFGIPTIERLVALAAARFAPEEHAEREEAHRVQHHVTLTHPRPGGFAGTSWLEAAGDTQDLTAFYALVCEEAKRLGRLGDTDDYETRKAKALGVIAARQGALELIDEAPDGSRVIRRPVRTHLYVHVSLADLATHLGGAQVVGEVEKLGPATLDLIRSWLHDSTARILPVLDLNRTHAVDRHDPPPWMRELVILRDRHCMFPRCGCDARSCDLDHTVPYVHPDEGGPPGQTNPQNLAPLCRRHHRTKTFTGWTYQRERDGTYEWTSPTDTLGPSDPTERRVRPRPHPPRRTEPRRTPSPPDRAVQHGRIRGRSAAHGPGTRLPRAAWGRLPQGSGRGYAAGVWSLWSENSLLSICSQDSILSIGSAASFASIASVGSFASAGSIGSAMSAASLLSHQSAGSALSHQSNGSVLSSQADHAVRGRRARGRLPAGTVAAGVLTVLAAIAVHRAHVGVTGRDNRGDDEPRSSF